MIMTRLQDVIFDVDFCENVEYNKEKHAEVCSWSADYPYNALTPRITDSDKNTHWTSTSFDYLLQWMIQINQ